MTRLNVQYPVWQNQPGDRAQRSDVQQRVVFVAAFSLIRFIRLVGRVAFASFVRATVERQREDSFQIGILVALFVSVRFVVVTFGQFRARLQKDMVDSVRRSVVIQFAQANYIRLLTGILVILAQGRRLRERMREQIDGGNLGASRLWKSRLSMRTRKAVVLTARFQLSRVSSWITDSHFREAA